MTAKNDIQDTYVKMEQREHIYKLPDTYIGSVEKAEFEMFIYEEGKMVKKTVNIVPGFYKIFDEILVNAYDQHARLKDEKKKVKLVKEIHVDINADHISVMNDGEGIDVEIHPEHQIYVPELIFGNLLTSANYEKKNKTTGGKNGIGSKCISGETLVPLFNGIMKKAKDITINDKLIGDDGNIRNILNITKGNGILYEVKQKSGETYIVNDNHTLTIHVPDHKVIFWNNHENGWSVVWWDKINKKINKKTISIGKEKIKCPECNEQLSSNLGRHYRRKHINKELLKKERKQPIKTPKITPEINEARKRLEDFCSSIDDNNIFDINIQDYLNFTETTKKRLAGIRGECINWKKREILLDPYVLGLWLGDGGKDGYRYYCDERTDPEIINYLTEWCNNNDMSLKSEGKFRYYFSSKDGRFDKNGHIFRNYLKKYNLINEKHIPFEYLVNDRDTRLRLLAGLIDTDGTVSRDGTRIGLTQGLNHERLAKDILFLSRSLGLHTTFNKMKTTWKSSDGERKEGEALSLNITGNIDEIPTLLPRKKCKTSFTHSPKTAGYLDIKQVENGDYIGFSIDGNQRFLINDMTITHNCTNIFSKKFIVETVDGSRKRHYTQVFENNMIIKNEPVIEEDYKEKPFTRITFYPDFERFGMEGMDADILGLLRKRVYDMCACTDKSVSVFLNGEKLDFKNFENYVNLFIGDKSEVKRVYHNDNERWEYCVCLSPDDKFEQVSFVNGIYTFKGGKHVDDLATKISTKLAKFVETKGKKKISLKPSLIRDNMWLFVRSIIEDPSFDSQTKEYLTTVPAKFGSKFQLDDKFIEKVGKIGIVEKAIALTNYKESFNALKNDGKKTSTLRGIPKLDDANWAGTPKSNECTLILTEGDSAKAFAISGLSVIGRDKYGVFPLKGKLLNVRDVEDKKIGDNEEITNLKKIMGLKQSTIYENTNDLRYGSVLILTDADVDGSHIKGLLLNFFHSMWPSLLKINGFVKSMRTPIVKAKKGSDIKVFYTLTDYEEWKETDTKGYEIKYYKGLGTSTSKEAKEYFTELDKNEIRYLWSEDNIVDETVTLAFAKEKADLRKDWLGNYDRKNILKDDENDVNIEDFINKDLIHFSKYDCERSVPSMVDGLKPSQRKVIYGTFLKNSQKELKVAQLAAYVAEHSAYHHGEQSLIGTIIGLAQNFVGSNNINLLEPIGMFGTRMLGGKDHSSARYIFTKMSDFMKIIFNKDDNVLLNYLDDDGDTIEPEYYVPIIPLVLVNGTEGIGTGFSSSIPSFNPLDIIANLRRKMKGEIMVEMKPWFRGFKGKVEKVDGKYQNKGIFHLKDNGTIEISELPVGRWTDKYKEFLETLMGKKGSVLTSYENHYTESTVKFVLHFDKKEMNKLLTTGKFERFMKLIDTGRTGMTNMHLFNKEGQIKKYNTPVDLMEEFYEIRREMYVKRKDYLENKLQRDLDVISARVRFIKAILDDEIILKGKDEEQLEQELETLEYPKFTKGLLEYNPKEENPNPSYDYLVSMPIRSMTKKRIEDLEKQLDDKNMLYETLKKKSINDLWEEDLTNLETLYEKELERFEKELNSGEKVSGKKKSLRKKK